MRLDGCEIVAKWREAGEWWNLEPYVEVTRFLDGKGIRREHLENLPSLGLLPASKTEYIENYSEDWNLRARKTRDEKMALARQSYVIGNESRDRPVKRQLASVEPPIERSGSLLHIASGYDFGRGVMLPQEIATFCALAGYQSALLADRFSFVGAHEFSRSCREHGLKPLLGVTISLEDIGEIVLVAKSKTGYSCLSRLISICHLDRDRLSPGATWAEVERYSRDVICLSGGDFGPVNRALTKRDYGLVERILKRLQSIFSGRLFLEIDRALLPWEQTVNSRLLELSQLHQVPCIAGGLVTHARPEHFPVQDIVVCCESLCTVSEVIGRKDMERGINRPSRALNAERYIRTTHERDALYFDRPELLRATQMLADMCDEDVLPARTRLPQLFENPSHAFRELTYVGAHERYRQIDHRLKRRIETEIERICRLNFSDHFLTMWDACRWAKDQEILFSGRGSVVDSVVAYCLGFSRIDAFKSKLHFDRFLPDDGSKRPDIDIDFEAHRRDDVRNYLTNKYGQDHVATVSAIGAFCTRGIIREVGKALDLPNEMISFLAKRIHGGVSPSHLEASIQSRPELRGSQVPIERLKWVFTLAERMMDIPRNMRAHSSGVVISSQPICETVPVMWSASAGVGEDRGLRIIQWDKRSCKHYFDKFDLLCLRGQDVLSGTQKRIRLTDKDFRVEQIAIDDANTYATIRSGELIGIPQSASPAMRQAHIRLKTTNLHETSLVQAGIRPGVGGAVKLNEMIARRHGKPFTFACPELEEILGITYGIIVFQEQVDQLLQTFCGYTSGEAEDIREEIHKRRREEFGQKIADEVRGRILANGYSDAIANEVFELTSGFKGYGFAQGHALAFAEISVRSVYCQQNFPSEYFAALLDAQPAGYYGPCTLVNEARSRGVAVLPLDINLSSNSFQVEDVYVPSPVASEVILARASEARLATIFAAGDARPLRVPNGGIRIPFSQVSGLSKHTRDRILEQRDRDYRSMADFAQRVLPERDELEKLILAGAFDGVSSNRRALMWAIPTVHDYQIAVKEQHVKAVQSKLQLEVFEPDIPDIDDFNQVEKAIHERRILDLDVANHLVDFERERISSRGGITTESARNLEHGRKAIVVGNPIRLRFPPTPSGKRVVFFDLEDETGLLNVTCFDAVYQKDGHAIVCSPYVTVIGVAQVRDGHLAFLAQRVFPYRPCILDAIAAMPDNPDQSGHFGWGKAPLPQKTADFLVS
ncbi:MAG: DNA polymerase III subunit alpha [Fimbriimonadaceae bacterium]